MVSKGPRGATLIDDDIRKIMEDNAARPMAHVTA
jgi:hypothetical protein